MKDFLLEELPPIELKKLLGASLFGLLKEIGSTIQPETSSLVWYVEFIRQAVRDKLTLLRQEPTAEELAQTTSVSKMRS